MENQIKKIISQTLGIPVEDVLSKKTLDELGATEVELTELIVSFEEGIGANLDDDMVTADQTVGDIVKYVTEVYLIHQRDPGAEDREGEE